MSLRSRFRFLVVFSLLCLSGVAQAATNVQSFTVSGTLMNAAGTAPLAEVVTLKFGIYDPSGTCLLYEESQSADLSQSPQGSFAVQVGSSPGAGKRTSWAGPNPNSNPMAVIFANAVIPPYAGIPAKADGSCAGNLYVPAAADGRTLRITATPLSTGVPVVLSPDQVITAAPQATTAETLQGKVPMDFVQVTGNASPRSLTDGELLLLIGGAASIGTSAADASTLHHHDSLYARINYADTKLGSRDLDLTGLTNGQSIRWNASATKWEVYSPGGGGSVTNITAGTGLTGGSISTSGTLSLANSGVTAGTYTHATVVVDSMGRITSASNGGGIDLSTETTGTLSVAKGGTGITSLGNNQTLTTNGSGLMTPISAGSSGQVLVQNSVAAAPFYSFITNANIDPAAAIVDTKLATLTSAGKVSGNTITSGTIGGSTEINTTGNLTAAALKVTGGAPAVGKVLTSDASGNATWQNASSSQWITNASDIGYTSGRVGIGTTSPAENLHISAAGAVGAKIQSSSSSMASLSLSNSNRNWQIRNESSGMLDIYDGSSFASRWVLDSSGNVGIGTTSPGARLDVFGGIAATGFKLVDGSQAANKVLMSDGNGFASWQNLPPGLAIDPNFNLKAGGSALASNSSSQYNIALGSNAAANVIGSGTTGQNIAIGRDAMMASSNASGTDNTALGYRTLANLSSGTSNIAVGPYALYYNASGSGNVAVGPYALQNNSSGGNSIAIGDSAARDMQATGTFAQNIALGQYALKGIGAASTGTFNFAAQRSSMMQITSGTYNVALGVESMREITSGNHNIALGYQAGYAGSLSSAVTTGSNNVFIGVLTQTSSNSVNSAVAIGQMATVQGSGAVAIGQGAVAPANTVALGGPSITDTWLKGKVGIGTTSSEFALNLGDGVAKDGAIIAQGYGTVGTDGASLGTSGAGTRMIWYPKKAAFRAGAVSGGHWDDGSIGNYSTAFGQSTAATAEGSAAFGLYSSANGNNSVAMGNMTSADSYGQVTIGQFNKFKGGEDPVNWVANDPVFVVGIGLSSGAEQNAMMILKNGNVGIGTDNPTQRLQVGNFSDGTYAIANAWNTFSDLRLKKDLAKIENARELLERLNGYYYYWKEGQDSSRQVGVIAQEVEAVLPELVKTGADGIKTVDYPKLTAVLIEASKAQNREIATLRAEKDKEVRELKERLERLESLIQK